MTQTTSPSSEGPPRNRCVEPRQSRCLPHWYWHEVVRLARFPFEQDELYTLQESRELFATTLRPGIDARPLYSLLHHVLTPLLPAGEFGARLPPFYSDWPGSWLPGSSEGTWAAPRVVSSRSPFVHFPPWHLFVSGEARYWSLIYLVSVGTLLLLLVGRAENSWGAFAGAGMLILVGTLTHPTFVFPFVGIGISVVLMLGHRGLLLKWPNRRELIRDVAARRSPHSRVYAELEARGAWQYSLKLVGPWVGRHPSAGARDGTACHASTSCGCGARSCEFNRLGHDSCQGCGTYGLQRRHLRDDPYSLLASTRTDVYADYGVSMLPLGIAAVVLLVCEGGLKAGRLAVGITGVLLAGMLPAPVSQLSDGMRFDYRPAYSAIASQQQFARPVLAWPLIVQRYYAPTLAATEFMRTTQQLDSLASTGQSFWVVASENRGGLVEANGGAVQAWLDNNCRRRLITQRTDWTIDSIE